MESLQGHLQSHHLLHHSLLSLWSQAHSDLETFQACTVHSFRHWHWDFPSCFSFWSSSVLKGEIDLKSVTRWLVWTFFPKGESPKDFFLLHPSQASSLQEETRAAGPLEFLGPGAGMLKTLSCLYLSCVSAALSLSHVKDEEWIWLPLASKFPILQLLQQRETDFFSSLLGKIFQEKAFFGLVWVRCFLLDPSTLARGGMANSLGSYGWRRTVLSSREGVGKVRHSFFHLFICSVNFYWASSMC